MAKKLIGGVVVVETIFYYICNPRSDGRVARLSSAKAATAVRIRFRPRLIHSALRLESQGIIFSV